MVGPNTRKLILAACADSSGYLLGRDDTVRAQVQPRSRHVPGARAGALDQLSARGCCRSRAAGGRAAGIRRTLSRRPRALMKAMSDSRLAVTWAVCTAPAALDHAGQLAALDGVGDRRAHDIAGELAVGRWCSAGSSPRPRLWGLGSIKSRLRKSTPSSLRRPRGVAPPLHRPAVDLGHLGRQRHPHHLHRPGAAGNEVHEDGVVLLGDVPGAEEPRVDGANPCGRRGNCACRAGSRRERQCQRGQHEPSEATASFEAPGKAPGRPQSASPVATSRVSADAAYSAAAYRAALGAAGARNARSSSASRCLAWARLASLMWP